MPATIEIPSALQRFVDNNASVQVPEGSVKHAIDALIGQYGGLREHLFDVPGRGRGFVRRALLGSVSDALARWARAMLVGR